MSDLISRQAAIDALKGLPTWWADRGGYYGGAQPPMVALLEPEDAVSTIENLPSAQPERKKGEWIKISPANIYECSECGKNVMTGDISEYDFCHGCGADMRGEQE